MRELTFDGLSPDGSRLVLAGKDGQKYTVAIDERVEAAVRRDRARMSQVEIEQSGMLRPREIQARIRAGATAEDVAAASGLPLEHIRRFEGPVLTERAWVAQQAQATEVRRPGGDIELGDLVAERLASQGVDPADISWDSWRRDDGMWVVIATFPVPPNVHVATWTYDSGARTMTVADDNARSLSAIDASEPVRLVASRPMLAPVMALVEDEDEDDEAATILTPMPHRDLDEELAQVEELEELDDLADQLEDLEGAGGQPGDEHVFPVDEGLEPDEGLTDVAEPGDLEPTDEQDDADAEDDSDEEEDDGPDDEPGDRDDDEVPDQDGAGPGPTADAEDVPLFPTPPAPHRPAGRPSVPSFDDILFGPGPAS